MCNEETRETRDRLLSHKCRIQLVIEDYWRFLEKLFSEGEITEMRYNHLKTFPQRFTDYELNEKDK